MAKSFVIYFSIFIILLSETHFTSEALTDAQRKEIESLRAELEDAFEKDEELTMQKHGVIVQPGWTQDHKAPHGRVQSKVLVTTAGLDEAKALRDEINMAVQQDTYSPLVGSGHIGADTRAVQELHKQFVNNKNNQKTSNTTMVAATMEENPSSMLTKPNVIEANSANLEPDIDIRKLQKLELNKRRTRESLVLESIEEDFSFNLGEHVLEWEHILHGGEEYFIGRLENDLQIVHKNAMQYKAGNILHIGSKITYLETYSFWNLDKQQQEGIILVATGDKVLWYRADEQRNEIVLYWEWVVGHAITGLTYFTADAQDFLVVSSNQSSRAGYYALNIYQFDLKNKEFWIAQRMQLEHACGEVTFLNTGRDFILAVPQNNTAKIYTFNPHTEASGHIRFQQKYSFDSEGIVYITAFQMGGRSYLALGGMQPQILLYQQGKFVPKTIFGNNFGLVEFFFPIPVRTYRDDLILLVQHRVDFDTHKLTVLETLIWDGEAFEATIPAPCKLGTHLVYGVGCMLDIQRDAGLKGAALLRRGDEISVIVPRHQAESGLFRLHTKLLAKNSEIMDLQDIFDFLKEWVDEQDKLIAQAQEFLAKPISSNQAVNLPDLDNLKLIKTPELFFNGSIKQLYINDYKWTAQDSMTDLNDVLNEIEQLGHELEMIQLQRHRRDVGTFSAAEEEETEGHNAVLEKLELDDVLVKYLNFEQLNDETYFIQNGSLNFDGVLNLVNLEVLENELFTRNRHTYNEEISLQQDLEFEKINGVLWQDLVQNLVFRNKPNQQLENLQVEGDVLVENDLKIEHLNTLKFPDDFLWSQGVQNQIITAAKTFTNTLAANHVDTEGLINGKDPMDIVTLTDAQEWVGAPTFAHLEVSEIFELNGTARGRGVEEFPNNPTLEDSRTINANCEFANLQILGSIKIQENFNDKPLETILDDIVQRPDDRNTEIRIPTAKIFSEVYFPIDFHVLDNAVNDINIEEFMPKHTAQNLNITKLVGNSFFNNLTINGRYDGIDIHEFLNNAIRINETQFLPKAQLNFVNVVKAKDINIQKTLNGVSTATGFQTINEDLQLPTANFESLKVNEAHVHGNTKANGTAANFNGLNFNDNLTVPFPIPMGNVFVDDLILHAALKVNEIQGINAEFLYNFLDSSGIDLPNMILDGKVQVDHIIVTGDLQVHKLNGQNFDEDIQMTAIWLNRPNYLSTNLQFVAPIDLQADLTVLGDYNGDNLPDLIDDMIFRNPNGTVLILAPKNFMAAINVLEQTKLDAINGLPFQEIATKRKLAHFKGNLKINGNLYVEDLTVNGSLNDFFMSNISDLVYFDETMQAFILVGTTVFETPLALNDLTVLGDLNNFKGLKLFFEDLVYKQGLSLLKGKYNFTGRVSMERGAYINQLNGHNLKHLFKNIIFINGIETIIIETPINFTSTVKASNLYIDGALTTNTLNGCDLNEWLNETLRVDQAENLGDLAHFATDSLHGNQFLVNYLNNIDLRNVITVHTPQNLTQANLTFSEVFLDGEISATGPINNADLEYEYENTVFVNSDGVQHIKTPLTMQMVNVLENLKTNGTINDDIELKDVVTLFEDVIFESPFYFQKLRARNVQTKDLLSGINFDDWYEQALWYKGREVQRITGNWSINQFKLDGEVESIEPTIDRAASARKMRESKDPEAVTDLCERLRKYLHQQRRKRPYFLKELKKAFEVQLAVADIKEDTIRKMFVLQNQREVYFLLNLNCNSLLLKWQIDEGRFKIVDNFESGLVEQALVLDTATTNELNFVTNSANQTQFLNCTKAGMNLWKFKDLHVEHFKYFGENTKEIWGTKDQKDILALTTEGLKHITANEPYILKNIEINDTTVLTSFHFMGIYDTEMKMYFSNVTHLMEISTNTNATALQKRQGRSILPTLFNDFNSNNYHPRSIHTIQQPADESILKPNTTLIKKVTFADFSQLIERILEDLDYRLSIEVNITQLSIPETDLYDAHLIHDFLAIMEELQTQNIYPKTLFADIDLSVLKIPENPAQVLAARTVQIVWPVIVEINEVHRYLQQQQQQDNTTANATASAQHPISNCILKHLGTAVHEILLLANTAPLPTQDAKDVATNYTEVLDVVIQRIRQFQMDIKSVIQEVELQIVKDLNNELDHHEIRIEEKSAEISLESVVVEEFSQPNVSLKSLQKLNFSKISTMNEIIKVEVGEHLNSRFLIAFTNKKVQLTPAGATAGQPAGIELYTDFLQNQLFQFIPAHRARSLTTIRIRDLTFLAYIEHCCFINVLQYRGVEGFVSFAKFSTNAVVEQLTSVSLPKDKFNLSHYLVAVFKRKLILYEFVIAGAKNASLEKWEACL